MSASTRATASPLEAAAEARFQATVVLPSRRREDVTSTVRTGSLAPVAQVNLKHAEGLRHLGREVRERNVLLERPVARHGGQDRRVEGPGDLLGAVQPAVGLLAKQGERDPEHKPEEHAERTRLQRLPLSPRGHVGGLDDLWAARAGGAARAAAPGVGAAGRRRRPAVAGNSASCSFTLARTRRGLGALRLGERARRLGVGRCQQRAPRLSPPWR